jgi:hypothetical protein
MHFFFILLLRLSDRLQQAEAYDTEIYLNWPQNIN